MTESQLTAAKEIAEVVRELMRRADANQLAMTSYLLGCVLVEADGICRKSGAAG